MNKHDDYNKTGKQLWICFAIAMAWWILAGLIMSAGGK